MYPVMQVNVVCFKSYQHSHPVCALPCLRENVLFVYVHADIRWKHNAFERIKLTLRAQPFQEVVVVRGVVHLMCGKSSAPTTPYPHLRQCSDRRPPHPHQFAISCPIYLYVYTPIYIRNIAFAHITSSAYQKLPFYIPEHYRCPLMRALRDADLHRPVTRRRRHVELPNQAVHIPSHGTSVPCPQHTLNQHMPVVVYNETTTTETACII